jgi:hypothetical protein
MSVSILERTDDYVVLAVKVPFQETMLETEERLQTVLNEAGTVASGEALAQYDTEGEPLEIEGRQWTSKGQLPKTYQTPYGAIEVSRHVYQSSAGGATYCPLEVDSRIIVTSTPRFAKVIAHKYAEMSGGKVIEDLGENHGRSLPLAFVQILAEAVGSLALAQEEAWHYQTPKQSVPIPTISIGLDGTCVLLCQEGFRQAMVGTISLYDAAGERQHTTYIAAAPAAGKAVFLSRLQGEVDQIKRLYPQAHYQGLADGAVENWQFLIPNTDSQIIDFYHVTQYLADVAKALHPRAKTQRQIWMDEACHDLKHTMGSAADLLKTMEALPITQLSQATQQGLQDAITYFRNHHHQMHYAEAVANHLPIGSGVTEAACKVLVKARLGSSGMKWKRTGAEIVLSLRALTHTKGRWAQFWSKINRYGCSFVQ